MSNAPLGAEEDSRAPWNQPKDIKYRRLVSLCLSYYDELELPPDLDEASIASEFKERAEALYFPNDVSIDSVVVMKDYYVE